MTFILYLRVSGRRAGPALSLSRVSLHISWERRVIASGEKHLDTITRSLARRANDLIGNIAKYSLSPNPLEAKIDFAIEAQPLYVLCANKKFKG